MKKRIYLAGKIARGDWRHEVVSGLRRAGRDGGEKPWPTLRAAILGRFDYVGPFFISCDHGGFHGPGSHGVGANPETGHCRGLLRHGAPDRHRRCPALCRCIDRADLFYAWLDDLTAFGTLAEIGHATGVGTCCIVVATPEAYATRMSSGLRSTCLECSTFERPTPRQDSTPPWNCWTGGRKQGPPQRRWGEHARAPGSAGTGRSPLPANAPGLQDMMPPEVVGSRPLLWSRDARRRHWGETPPAAWGLPPLRSSYVLTPMRKPPCRPQHPPPSCEAAGASAVHVLPHQPGHPLTLLSWDPSAMPSA